MPELYICIYIYISKVAFFPEDYQDIIAGRRPNYKKFLSRWRHAFYQDEQCLEH